MVIFGQALQLGWLAASFAAVQVCDATKGAGSSAAG